jgi:hypothetical protein
MKKMQSALTLIFGAALLLSATSARAAPTAIGSCENITVPGSYILQKNLKSAGNCLVISASPVTINLNGFSITNVPASTSGTLGISTTKGTEFTTVTNGYVSNFATCVQLETDGTAVVQSVKMFGCVDGLVAGGIISDNVVLSAPPATPATGMQVSGVISGNMLINNHDGMFVGSGSNVFNNTLNHGGGAFFAGIFANCPSNIFNNTVVGYEVISVGVNDDIVLSGSGCNVNNNDAGGNTLASTRHR